MFKRTIAVMGCLVAGTVGFFSFRLHALPAGAYAFSTIDVPSSRLTVANGIDVLGRIVGHYVDPGGTHGFEFVNGEFSTLDFPGAQWTAAYGVNVAGQIVGAYGPDGAGGRHGFLLSNGRFSSLDVPGGSDTVARGVNSQGQIVGDYAGPDGARHGFLLSSGTYATIEVPKSEAGAVGGINDPGHTVGRAGAGVNGTGFLFANGQFSRIQAPENAYTEAWGINNRGDIVGQAGGPDAPYRGFLKTAGEYLTIEVPGLPFSWDARGISDLGEIVGSFVDNDGKTHGYRATPLALREGPRDPRLTEATRTGGTVTALVTAGGRSSVSDGPVAAGTRGSGFEAQPGVAVSPTRDALARALSDIESASTALKRASNQGDAVKRTVTEISVAIADVNAAIRFTDTNPGNDTSAQARSKSRPDFTAPPKPVPHANANLYLALGRLKNAYDGLEKAPGGAWGGLRTKIDEDIAAAVRILVPGIVNGNKRFEGRGASDGEVSADGSSQRQPQDGICVYENTNYKGRFECWNVGQNAPTIGRDRNDWNDRISSIRVFGRGVAELYQNRDFAGGRVTVDRDTPDLSTVRRELRPGRGEGRELSWNDQVTSIRVISRDTQQREAFNNSK